MLKEETKLYAYLDMLPVGCSIFRVEMDEARKPIDIIYEFANIKYCSLVGKKQSEITKESFFAVFERAEEEWLNICYRTACLGEAQHFTRYSIEIDRWIEYYVAQPEYGYCLYTCMDITNEKKAREQLQMRETDDFVLKCAHILHAEIDPDTAINQVLGEVGARLRADRAYILETNRITVDNTYEWCKEGVTPEMGNLQNVQYSVMEKWERRLRKSEFVSLEDIYDANEISPEEYNILTPQGIGRLLAVPMYDGPNLAGYVGVDNYNEGQLFEALKILQSVSYFLSSYLKNRQLVKQLIDMSYHDSLTNAWNRVAFSKCLRERMDEFQDAGVLYIDINGLKLVNNQYGHKEGDSMICAMYTTMASIFPENSIYRVGGDEFAVIEDRVGEEEFEGQIRRLHTKVEAIPMLEFACGSCWISGKADIYRALKIADEAMYEDKKKFYTDSVIKNGRYRPQLDDRFGFTDNKVFHELLSNGQIIFYLQPKILGESHSLAGAEALVRYVRCNGEVVSAWEFISLLESTYYISELDYFIFKNVCIQIQKWLDAGITPVRIAVNFSRHTVSRMNFINDVLRIWESCPVPKEYIEVEITESMVAENKEAMKEMVAALRKNGFTVSMDDFGIEQSNLSTLIDMDFDYVKIDKSIIDTMPHMRKTNLLIKGLVGICHDLGIKIVAEGVEKQEQLAALADMEVDEIQGFYFSQALPCDQFEREYLVKEDKS